MPDDDPIPYRQQSRMRHAGDFLEHNARLDAATVLRWQIRSGDADLARRLLDRRSALESPDPRPPTRPHFTSEPWRYRK